MKLSEQEKLEAMPVYQMVWYMSFWEIICQTKNRLFIIGTWSALVIATYSIIWFLQGMFHGQNIDDLLAEIMPLHAVALVLGSRGMWGMYQFAYGGKQPCDGE